MELIKSSEGRQIGKENNKSGNTLERDYLYDYRGLISRGLEEGVYPPAAWGFVPPRIEQLKNEDQREYEKRENHEIEIALKRFWSGFEEMRLSGKINEQQWEKVKAGGPQALGEICNDVAAKLHQIDVVGGINYVEGPIREIDQRAEKLRGAVEFSEQKLSPDQKILLHDSIAPIRKVFDVTMGALFTVLPIEGDIKKQEWSGNFFRWAGEKIKDAALLMNGGVFPGLKKIIAKWIGGKEKIDAQQRNKQEKYLSFSGHLELMGKLFDRISLELARMDTLETRGDLTKSLVNLRAYSHAMKKAQADTMRVLQGLEPADLFYDLGIDERPDLQSIVGQYLGKVLELSSTIDSSTQVIEKVIIRNEKGEDLQAIMRAQILKGVVNVADYKDYIDLETQQALGLRENILAFFNSKVFVNVQDSHLSGIGVILNDQRPLRKIKTDLQAYSAYLSESELSRTTNAIEEYLKSISIYDKSPGSDQYEKCKEARVKLEQNFTKLLRGINVSLMSNEKDNSKIDM